jgi:NAD(P)H-nitrite reductase large subunit
MRSVIVGASAAGMAAAAAIRKRDPTAEIVILSDEPQGPYYRPLIPYLIYQGKPESEILRDARSTPNTEIRLSIRATALDPDKQTLTLSDGSQLSYDRLLLATGASPVRPNLPGLDGPGVFTLRTWEDAIQLAALAQGARQAVILGAGRIGLKAAFALRQLEMNVTVVELLDRLIPQQLDPASARIFAGAVAGAGIRTLFGRTLRSVNRAGSSIKSVTLDDGRELPADLVILAVGVRPNLELALSAGLKTGRGLKVDAGMRTSAPRVFAAGDVVETVDILTGQPCLSGIWTNAVNMGRVAGDNMAGGDARYEGAFSLLNALELAGLPVISVGEIQSEPGDGTEVFSEQHGNHYRKLVFRGDRLVGLILVGQIERAGLYQTLLREKADISALRRELTGPRFHYGHCLVLQPSLVDRYALGK